MVIKMTKAHAEKLKRSCDWIKVCKQVRRYINEGSDYFSIHVGEFEVEFNATETKGE